ncbi:hypothetical protein B1B04_01120 [Lysinibacillus sp. KCTC 33748]|uniref:methyltransferase domain-containing protein n=1 Tax=unclassified Lysinibacillus TaxID=2636778 RepID=UPI0009A832C3|nr:MULTISPECIES: methyltransferase domain-containing protein [unclassified Lysinibacillus]OXS77033.1 hypothetical protein B1B04_01120 [Lysinibacillus sp. KCTC 33748]SKB29047.1 Protein kinase domain-containing protein [Lysinibacillus sp. AC-3]
MIKLNENNRSEVFKIVEDGVYLIKKNFKVKNECLRNEKLAFGIFNDFSWMTKMIIEGENYFVREYLPGDARLDIISIKLTEEEKENIAGQILDAILDMYTLGYCHRDLHAKNIFVIDGKIKIIDFEVMGEINKSVNNFITSYDLSGVGMDSPYETNHMCFMSNHPLSITNILEVNLSSAINELEKILKRKLQEVTSTFQTVSSSYTTTLGKIYSSFNLPSFNIDSSITQRNNNMRLKKFKIEESDICSKTILDLGCNAGGMLFEIQKLYPAKCLGIEYGIDKVVLANKIAAYSNLKNLVFQQADIDNINLSEFNKTFDVVLCLSIEGHLKNKKKLFELLGKVTGNLLLFEGNANTDIYEVKEILMKVGFNYIEDLGFCNDDALEENNCRPLLKAYKN